MNDTKFAVVTGGAGDIGRAIAARLAAGGWHIAVVDLFQEAVDKTVASLAEAVGFAVDVTDDDAVDRMLDKLGVVPDLVVNNAGIFRGGPLIELSSADFRKVIDVNLVGAYIVARAAARRMIPRGKGSIINVTSLNARAAGPGNGAYPASKAGLANLTEQMALEWGPLGLRVNAVAPGFIDAGLSTSFYRDPHVRARRSSGVPSQRLGSVEDVAEAVFWLASDAASYVHGHSLAVDGGVCVSLLSQLPR